jgi:preprotein translocase subunit SecF
MNEQQNQETHKKNWHDKHYKNLLLIPIVLLLFSLVYLGIFYSQHNDIFLKDISLTGGTSVTINGKLDIILLEDELVKELGEVNIRKVSDLITGEQLATIIETTASSEDTKAFLEEYLGYELNEENSSFEFSESSFTRDLYRQLILALLLAFLLMTIVVFILFRNFVPSLTVVFAVLMDIIMTIAVIDILGIKISTGGIIALLMLIGYSVDTDILLTNRILKRHEGTLNEKIKGAFKTGITMTLTSLFAVVASLLVVKSFSAILTQIFLIISIGLLFDIVNTWITNVSILKWYVNKKENHT